MKAVGMREMMKQACVFGRRVTVAVIALGATVATAANWSDYREQGWPGNGNVQGDVYTINNAAELAQFAWTVNQGNNYQGKTVTLAADINLSGNLWTPAGTIFCGTFDGDGRTISSMTINMADTFAGELNAGLFGVIEKGSVIKNIRFTDVNIWCAKSGMNVVRVGAVAGVAWKALIENCVVDGTIGDKDSYLGQNAIAGGIVGDHLQGGVIRNCINHATIWVEATGNGLALGGGIAGVLMESRIENCLNTGQVWGLAAGTLEVGGLVGRVDTRNGITVETWIENCLNTGIVKCSTAGPAPARLFVGALVGDCNHSTVAVANSYWTTDIEPLGGGAASANTVIKATGTPGTLESTHPTLDVDDLEFALVYWATLQNDVTPDRFVSWSTLGTSDGYPAPVLGTVASVTFTVTLDYNDGSGFTDDIPVTFNMAMPGGIEIPERLGYTFLGFFGNGGVMYYDADMTSARNWDQPEGGTLSAEWGANAYTVTFNYDGATDGTNEVTRTVNFNAAYGKLPEPKKPDYGFGGWFLGNDEILSDTLLATAENHALTAKWTVVRVENWIDYREQDWPDNGNVLGDVYIINNAAELAQFAWMVNQDNGSSSFLRKTVELAADIDLAGKDWTPIGKANPSWPFAGTFDGKGKTIKGLTIVIETTSPAPVYAGLFRDIHCPEEWNNPALDPKIDNIHFTDANIRVTTGGNAFVGVLAGHLGSKPTANCTLTDVHIEVIGKGGLYVGGLSGMADSGLIENCIVERGTISAQGGHYNQVGGIVGSHEGKGTIRNCVSAMNIETKEGIGATAITFAGGIAGRVRGAWIQNSQNLGEIKGLSQSANEIYTYIGGIVGSIGTFPSISENNLIENCLNTGPVVMSGPLHSEYTMAGAIAGNFENVNPLNTVRNAYWRPQSGLTPLGGASYHSSVQEVGAAPGHVVSHPSYGSATLESALNQWVTAHGALYKNWSLIPGMNDDYPLLAEILTMGKYQVLIDHNNGTGTIGETWAEYNKPMPKLTTVPVFDGYIFLGFFDNGGVMYYDADMASARDWDKAGNDTLYAGWEMDLTIVPEITDEGLAGVHVAAINVTLDNLVTLTWQPVKDAVAYYIYCKRTLADLSWDGIFVEEAQITPVDGKLSADVVMENGLHTEYRFFTMKARVQIE